MNEEVLNWDFCLSILSFISYLFLFFSQIKAMINFQGHKSPSVFRCLKSKCNELEISEVRISA